MNFFFVDIKLSGLSDSKSTILNAIKDVLFLRNGVEEVISPEHADVIVIQEKNSFKNFNYIKDLESDDLISRFAEKIFTINTDDCATGLLRGLYTSLPKNRFNSNIYSSVPYMEFPNELVFNSNSNNDVNPTILASWRGNTKSNNLRSKMVSLFEKEKGFYIQKTDSWLNHNMDEKRIYAELIRHAKFSLCPAGWAPVSFRIYESMALGRCPVIIADNFVPPEGPDWEKFAIFYPEKKLPDLPSFLLSKEHLAEELGKQACEAWQLHFSKMVIARYYADALVSLITSSPKTSRQAELTRWKSFVLHWNNKWTFGQRALNSLNKIARP